MTRFRDLLKPTPLSTPKDEQIHASVGLANAVASSNLRWWERGRALPHPEPYVLLAVAPYSQYDLTLLDLVDETVGSGPSEAMPVYVVNLLDYEKRRSGMRGLSRNRFGASNPAGDTVRLPIPQRGRIRKTGKGSRRPRASDRARRIVSQGDRGITRIHWPGDDLKLTSAHESRAKKVIEMCRTCNTCSCWTLAHLAMSPHSDISSPRLLVRVRLLSDTAVPASSKRRSDDSRQQPHQILRRLRRCS